MGTEKDCCFTGLVGCFLRLEQTGFENASELGLD